MAFADYAEFSDPKVAELYDVFNQLGADEFFWLKTIQNLPVKRIVDMGCGTGLLTLKLADLGYDVTGVEPARPMLEIAKRKPNADKVRWIEGTYKNLKDIETDLVLMTSHVAQFFLEDTEWTGFLDTAHASIQPGGFLLFDSKNPETSPWIKWDKENSMRTAQVEGGNAEMWVELKELVGNRVRYEIHYLLPGTTDEAVSKNELIYRTFDQINESVKDSGFEIVSSFGDWDASPYERQSPEIITLAKRI